MVGSIRVYPMAVSLGVLESREDGQEAETYIYEYKSNTVVPSHIGSLASLCLSLYSKQDM